MLLVILILASLRITPISAVIGGDPLPPYTYSHLVSIKYKGEYRCAGFIYSKDYVITSAVCMRFDIRQYSVQAAEHNVRCIEGYEQIRRLRNVSFPDGRHVTDRPGFKDIAILQLNAELKLGGDADKANVAKNPFIFPKEAEVAGWGSLLRFRGGLPTPNFANLTEVDFTKCNQDYKGELKEGVICYGNSTTSPCAGDLGAPLMCSGLVCGIYNQASGCGLNDIPGIFTSIPYYLDWIKQVTGVDPSTGRSLGNEKPAEIRITTCGGYYEITSGFIQLQGLSSGQKCFFAIKSPFKQITLKLNATTLQKEDNLFVTAFCMVHPCKRWKLGHEVGSATMVHAPLIMVTVDISNSNPSAGPRGFTLSLNSSGPVDMVVPYLASFTVLNGSSPKNFKYPTQGGVYGNHEFGLVVLDLPNARKDFTVTITSLDVENPVPVGDQCYYDAVSYYKLDKHSFPLLARFCGNKIPNPVKFPGNFGIMTMISDDASTGKGFSFEFK